MHKTLTQNNFYIYLVRHINTSTSPGLSAVTFDVLHRKNCKIIFNTQCTSLWNSLTSQYMYVTDPRVLGESKYYVWYDNDSLY